jgi:hypothetical protein
MDDRDSRRRERGNRILVLLAGISGAAVFVGSLLEGAPQHLPGAALGWPLFLYLGRAAAVALLIMGVGGIGLSLLTGGQVQSVGATPPTVGVEDQTKPTEVLKGAVSADIKDLSERVTNVEKRQEGDNPDASNQSGEE